MRITSSEKLISFRILSLRAIHSSNKTGNDVNSNNLVLETSMKGYLIAHITFGHDLNSIFTFPVHANMEAFFQPTELASVSIFSAHLATFIALYTSVNSSV